MSYFSWLLEASGTNNSPFRKVLQNYRAKRCLGARQLTSTRFLLSSLVSSHFPLPSPFPFPRKKRKISGWYLLTFFSLYCHCAIGSKWEKDSQLKKIVEQYASNKSTILGHPVFYKWFFCSFTSQYRNVSIVFSGETYIFFRVLTNEILKGLIGYQNVE